MPDRRFLIPLLSALVIVTACGPQGGQQKEKQSPVRFLPNLVLLEAYESVPELQLSGVVLAAAQPELAFQVAGTVVYVSSKLITGAFFSKGELIASLDPREFDIAVEQAKAGVAQAKADYEREQARKDITDWQYQQQNEQPSQLASYESQVKNAKLKIERALLLQDIAEIQRQRSELRAPFDLVISSVNIATGDSVGAKQVVATGYDPTSLIVRSETGWEELQMLGLQAASARSQPSLDAVLYSADQEFTDIESRVLVQQFALGKAKLAYVGATLSVAQTFPLTFELVGPVASAASPLKLGQDVVLRVRGDSTQPLVAVPQLAFAENGSIGLVSELGEVERHRPLRVGSSDPGTILIASVDPRFTHVIADNRVYIADGALVYQEESADMDAEENPQSLRL